jgi:hypothetical protein
MNPRAMWLGGFLLVGRDSIGEIFHFTKFFVDKGRDFYEDLRIQNSDSVCGA